MALQTSGQISISDIAAEFGASAPHKMSDFYRGGEYVPDIPQNSDIPTSGPIKPSQFYGARALDPGESVYKHADWEGGSGLNTNLNTGYSGANGSLDPATLNGADVIALYHSDTQDGVYHGYVVLSGNRGSSFFNTATLPGIVLDTSAADSHGYDSLTDRTTWEWTWTSSRASHFGQDGIVTFA